MKKIKKTTKLSLDTEIVVNLTDPQMAKVAGGYTNTCLGTACQCAPTYGPDCETVGFTNCLCTYGYPTCGGQTNTSGRGC